MLRSRTAHIAKFSSIGAALRTTTRRQYANVPNPPPADGPASAKAGGSNMALYAGLALAAGGGVYYYFAANPDKAAQLKAKAKREEEEAIRKSREAVDAGKARVEDGIQQGKQKYEQTANSAQAKYDDYKKGAQNRLNDAKDSTENLYNEAKARTQSQAEATKGGVQRKEEQAKAGWFNWLGWGSNKAEEAKREGASKVSDAAEDVKSKADKHT
ncbi:hypothetical protein E1B28_010024 [Marasmius oreades]|uniref:Late embryogenesis abundant protein n=1 Tax=Marasmius oreades TaxID=181124 RepID=A0A9P7RW95_9AGAR|nr:uncharacterized protein E1B28_010024 [Marasmius oreades]KAG7090956.1 hypothetical protein E1B28_010024 [Marasmius oreades]